MAAARHHTTKTTAGSWVSWMSMTSTSGVHSRPGGQRSTREEAGLPLELSQHKGQLKALRNGLDGPSHLTRHTDTGRFLHPH